ncbi:unnamed protein product, partial [Laminaria digitata]
DYIVIPIAAKQPLTTDNQQLRSGTTLIAAAALRASGAGSNQGFAEHIRDVERNDGAPFGRPAQARTSYTGCSSGGPFWLPQRQSELADIVPLGLQFVSRMCPVAAIEGGSRYTTHSIGGVLPGSSLRERRRGLSSTAP